MSRLKRLEWISIILININKFVEKESRYRLSFSELGFGVSLVTIFMLKRALEKNT